jgi:SAM-dependent methyltransferase
VLTIRFDRLGVQPGDLVLDAGAGFGRHAFELARRGANVVALDYAADEVIATRNVFGAMLEGGEIAADRYVGVLRGDATRLPFADDSFDRVITSEVLEHIQADVDAIAELVRILRPGGEKGDLFTVVEQQGVGLGQPQQARLRDRHGAERARHELAAGPADDDLLLDDPGVRCGLGERAVGALQVGLRQLPGGAVEHGETADPPVAAGGGADGEHLDVAPVDEARADVDERTEHLGDVALALPGLEQRFGAGAGQQGTDRGGAEGGDEGTHRGRGQGRTDRPAAAAEPRLGAAAVQRAQHGDHDQRRREPGGRHRDPQPVRAQRGGEHEQHTPGDDGLGAAVRAERERVGEHRHEPDAEGGRQQERTLARHRCDGGGELAPHQPEVDLHEVEGVAAREHRREGAAVEEQREQLEHHEQQHGHREPAGNPRDAQQDADRVHADGHDEQRVEERPVGEDPAHRRRGDDAEQGDRRAGDHVVDVARTRASDTPVGRGRGGAGCAAAHAGSR